MLTQAPTECRFSRADLLRDAAALSILHKRGCANAVVYRYDRADGPWVVKDFSNIPAVLRHTVGPYLVRRECEAMSRLDGLTGFPRDVFLLDEFAICYRYMEGRSLRGLPPGLLSVAFFRELERMVWRMHRRDVVHLDLRYRSNILLRADGSPGVLDFQSHLRLSRFPRRWRKLLRRTDYSGVYKQWCKRVPRTIGERRLGILQGTNRWRRFWILAGYRVIKLPKANWREYEQNHIARPHHP